MDKWTGSPITVDAGNILSLQLYSSGMRFHAYKVIRTNGRPSMHAAGCRVRYKVGSTYRVKKANINPRIECAEGLHVATLDWCCKTFERWERKRHMLVLVEFTVSDIASVPYNWAKYISHNHWQVNQSGKMRVKRFKIVKKVKWPAKF